MHTERNVISKRYYVYINFKEKEKNDSLSKKVYYLKKKRQRGNIVQIKSAPPNTCAIKSVRHES